MTRTRENPQYFYENGRFQGKYHLLVQLLREIVGELELSGVEALGLNKELELHVNRMK